MWRLKTLYEEIRKLERGGEERERRPSAGALRGGDSGADRTGDTASPLLVLWLYELPARPASFGRAPGLLAPSILLTHPKGPLCLLLILVGVAIATVCRDLAELTREHLEEAEQQVFELQRSVSHAYVLTGFTAAIALFLGCGG